MHAQEDWLLRQIAQLGAALARALGLATGEAHDVLEHDTAARRLLDGYGLHAIMGMSLATVVSVFGPSDRGFEPIQSLAIANTMVEMAAEADERGDLHAPQLYLNAVALYAALDRPCSVRAPFAAEHASRAQPDVPGWRAILSVHERLGALSAAEDAVFELAAVSPSEGLAEGTAFYRRLEALDDDTLAAAELDREDITLGMSQLRELVSA